MFALIDWVEPWRPKWDWSSRETAVLLLRELNHAMASSFETFQQQLSGSPSQSHHLTEFTYQQKHTGMQRECSGRTPWRLAHQRMSDSPALTESWTTMSVHSCSLWDFHQAAPMSPRSLFTGLQFNSTSQSNFMTHLLMSDTYDWILTLVECYLEQTSCIWDSWKTLFSQKPGAMPQVTFFPGKCSIYGAVDQSTLMPGFCVFFFLSCTTIIKTPADLNFSEGETQFLHFHQRNDTHTLLLTHGSWPSSVFPRTNCADKHSSDSGLTRIPLNHCWGFLIRPLAYCKRFTHHPAVPEILLFLCFCTYLTLVLS